MSVTITYSTISWNVQGKFNQIITEPGTVVGRLAAQSIDIEMILKAFHFAGVASRSTTCYNKKITTPIITVEIENNTSMNIARKVKASTLGGWLTQ